jgi:hypothetical protein
LTVEARASISDALGWDPLLLDGSSMDCFREIVFNRRENGNPSQSKDWTRGSGTRYCPECLRENPGVFYSHWRLWWSFACLRHSLVLRDTCGACQRPIIESKIQDPNLSDPTVCRHELDDGTTCNVPFQDTWTEQQLPESSRILKAQRSIQDAWKPTSDHALRRVFQEGQLHTDYFRTLRGAGIALLRTKDTQLISDLSGVAEDEFHGLYEAGSRTGTSAPKEALFMAVLMAAAHYLHSAPEDEVSPIIRYITFSKPVTVSTEVFGPGSAAHLLSFWSDVGTSMQGRVVRAVDSDLSPIQRLVWGSAIRPEFAQLSHLASLFRRGAKTPSGRQINSSVNGITVDMDAVLPSLLWTNWANPLGVDPRTEPSALQRSLTDAVRIAGLAARRPEHPTETDVDLIAGIGKKLRPEMLGNPDQTKHVLRQICELASLLRVSPPPINYQRRRYLAWWTLLPVEHWRILAESVGENPGKEPKLLRVRRFMFLRATGCGTRDLPHLWHIQPSTHDAADYTEFLTTMSAELVFAIDRCLEAWLKLRGDSTERSGLPALHSDEAAPVTWEPPRWIDPDANLERELSDIDIDLLHDRVRAGQYTITHLAQDTHRAPRHVRWALSASPVPTGNFIEKQKWEVLIPPTTTFLRDNRVAVKAWSSGRVDFGAEYG